MNRFRRSIPLLAILTAFGAGEVSAQVATSQDYRWFVGGQAGAFVYRTPAQTRGAIPIAGGNLLVKARRGGLYLAVEEAFATEDQQSSYNDAGCAGGTCTVTFRDVRRYSFGLMAFPFNGAMRPYLGIGGGIMHVVSPQPLAGGSAATASELGSGGFGALMAGLDFNVGGLSAFGHYQIQTTPGFKASGTGSGRLINGTVHSVTGGLRISLGSSREDL